MKKSLIIVLIIIMSVVSLNAVNNIDFTVNGQNSTTEFQRNNDLAVNYSLKERFAEIKERIGEREFNKKAYFWSGFAMSVSIPIVAAFTYMPFLGTFDQIYHENWDYIGSAYGWSYLISLAVGISAAAVGAIPFAGPIITSVSMLSAAAMFFSMFNFPVAIGLVLTGLIQGSAVIMEHLYFAYLDRSKKLFSMDVLPYADSNMNPGFSVGVRFAL